METMYKRVKRMTKTEMREFIYLVYLCGNKDGKQMLCDSPYGSYFVQYMLNGSVEKLMPNDKVSDLYESWKATLGE